jgi:hypothetical protein
MKHILPLFIPLLLVGLVGCGKAAGPPVEQHSELAMRIGSALPQNWSLEESNGQIMISRRDPIT